LKLRIKRRLVRGARAVTSSSVKVALIKYPDGPLGPPGIFVWTDRSIPHAHGKPYPSIAGRGHLDAVGFRDQRRAVHNSDSELDKPMGQVSGFWLTWLFRVLRTIDGAWDVVQVEPNAAGDGVPTSIFFEHNRAHLSVLKFKNGVYESRHFLASGDDSVSRSGRTTSTTDQQSLTGLTCRKARICCCPVIGRVRV
jgi:hypothetical protein